MKRSFHYDGRGRKPSFTVETSLTDSEAINLLTNQNGIQPGEEATTFEAKCAFEIHKQAHGFTARSNMVAWGFKIAEQKVNPIKPLVFREDIRLLIKHRKPLRGTTEDGEPFNVMLCGERSKHVGNYSISDGEPYGVNRFYGFAKPVVGKNGKIARYEWRPTSSTPESIKAKLGE